VKIHRSNRDSHFTIIPDETLRDSRLSWQARGLLAEILSRPDDWITSADRLWADARRERYKPGEGRDKIRAAFAELDSAGYLSRERKRGPAGRIVTELHIYDISASRTGDSTDNHWSDSDKYISSPADPAPADQASMGQEQTSLQRPGKETPHRDLSNGNSLSRATAELRVSGGTEKEIEEIVRQIEANPKVIQAGSYLEGAIKNGDGPDLIISARKRLAERDGIGQASAKRPPWCGVCDERTRMIGEDNPHHCPNCHPMTAASGGD
jgi:hypothetical protein